MIPSDFASIQRKFLVRHPTGYWAFCPPPLPPTIEPSWELVGALSRADREISKLAGLARTIANPHILISPFIRMEAVLSSRIEGTQASLSDLFLFEASSPKNDDATGPVLDTIEVSNYVTALEYGLRRVEELPISSRLLREMHERLMYGVRGAHLTPGEFRRSQNWIGSPGCTLTDAAYVPPPREEMMLCLSQLETFIHGESSLPPLIKLALVHYQFEAIHPFLDGNGRIGRLLITLMLCTEEILPSPLLYLSAYFERNRPSYYEHLRSVSQTGGWTKWILFFLDGITEQSLDASFRARKLTDLQQSYRKKLHMIRAAHTAIQLADLLFEFPIINVRRASEILQTSSVTAHSAIVRLQDVGILVERTGKRRNRLYVAAEIIDVVEREGPKVNFGND